VDGLESCDPPDGGHTLDRNLLGWKDIGASSISPKPELTLVLERAGRIRVHRRSARSFTLACIIAVVGILVLTAPSLPKSSLSGNLPARMTTLAPEPRRNSAIRNVLPSGIPLSVYLADRFDLFTGTPVAPDQGTPDLACSNSATYDPLTHDLLVAAPDGLAWFNASSLTVTRWAFFNGTGAVGTTNIKSDPPYESVVDTRDDLVYVTHAEDYDWFGMCGSLGPPGDYVSVLNDSTGALVTTIGGGNQLTGLAFDSANDRVYVVDSAANRLLVINGSDSGLVGYIQVGMDPQNVVYDPTSGNLYVACSSGSGVSIVNATAGTLAGSIPLPAMSGGAFDVAYDPSNRLVFADGGSGLAAVINATSNRVESTVPIGSGPAFIAWDSLDDEVAFASSGSRTISVLHEGSSNVSIETNVSSADVENAIAFDPETDQFYALGVEFQRLSVFNATASSATWSIDLGYQADSLAYDPSNERVYTDPGFISNWIPVENVSTKRSVPAIPLFYVASLVYDPRNQRLFAENPFSAEVGSVSTRNDTPGANLTNAYFAGYGQDLVWDPTHDTIWVYEGCGGTYCTSTLEEVDAGNGTTVRSYSAGEYEAGIAAYGPAHLLWVDTESASPSNFWGNLMEIDTTTNSIVWNDRLPVNNFGSVAYDPESGDIWMENGSEIALFNVSSGSSEGTVDFGGLNGGITPLAYDAPIHAMVVAGQFYPDNGPSTNNLVFYNATTGVQVANLSTPSFAADMAEAGSAGDIYFVSDTDAVDEVLIGSALHISGFSATPSTAEVGSLVTLSTTAGGGTGPLSFSYAGLPKPCASVNSSTLLCTPSEAGRYSVTVTVTDSTGRSTNSTLELEVAPALSVGTLYVNASSVGVGSSVTFSANVSGGFGSYAYNWTGLPPGCGSGGPAPFNCTPMVGGTFNISLTVTDAAGVSKSTGSISLFVHAPIQVRISSSASDIELGGTIHLTAVTKNVTPNTSYAWTHLPTGCVSENATNLSCTPTGAGSFPVKLTADDPLLGVGVSNSINITVQLPKLHVIASDSRISADIGQRVTFWANATGGSGAYVVRWSGLPASCPNTTGSPITCLLTEAGTYSPLANVTDSNGNLTSQFAPQLSVSELPVIGAVTASRRSVDVGQTVWFNGTATVPAGGAEWRWYDLPPGCVGSGLADFECAPTRPGTYASSAIVEDENGGESPAFPIGNLTVYADPSVVSLTISPPTALGAATFTFTANVSKGSGGDRFVWELPAGCSSENSTVLTCTLSGVGEYHVSLSVTDSNGVTVVGGPESFNITGRYFTLPSRASRLPASSGPGDWLIIAVGAGVVSVAAIALFVSFRRGPR
jgi:DNA-binding beta-propeller fold protein YncE